LLIHELVRCTDTMRGVVEVLASFLTRHGRRKIWDLRIVNIARSR